MDRIRALSDVVDWRLCLGCGACAYVCPQDEVSLLDFLDEGIRPVVGDGADCTGCRDCLEVCPGVESDLQLPGGAGPADEAFEREWGAVVAIWEGHATDPDIRFRGASGGALTALAAYCQEELGMHGTLHIGQDDSEPVRNRTRLSRTRAELLAATGSRYSPASVCNGLGLVEQAPEPCAVIGKPSEIAAVRNACRMRPALADRVGVTLSFFCAETPSTAGTVALVRKMGADPGDLDDLRYRGLGWPGFFAPTPRGDAKPIATMTYRESWAFLQAFRPWVTQLWPDGTGEAADISCGDPWYEEPDGRNPGFSLVVARTERGRRIVEGAVEAGYLALTPAEPWKLARSQAGLATRRGAIWGRRLASRALGLPVTALPGVDLRASWRPLRLADKLRATLGTLRRLVVRGLLRRSRLDPLRARPVPPPVAGGEGR